MYAIITTGGKQYRVAEGDVLSIEKLPEDSGQSIDFNDVLLVSSGEKLTLGTPLIDGAKVTAEVVEHTRDPKIRILKFKRRKHHMKRMGHRQHKTQVKITGIKEGK